MRTPKKWSVAASLPSRRERGVPSELPFCGNSYRLLRVCESRKNSSIRKPMSLLSGFPQRLLERSTCRCQVMRTRWCRIWKREASGSGFPSGSPRCGRDRDGHDGEHPSLQTVLCICSNT